MGLSGISIWQLLIVLAVVVLLFGTRKLRNVGADLGAGIKGLRDGLKDPGKPDEDNEELAALDSSLNHAKSKITGPLKRFARRSGHE